VQVGGVEDYVWKTNYCNNNKSEKTGIGWSFSKNDKMIGLRKEFLGKPDGRRNAGRPKLRWFDTMENISTSTGVKRWREKAADRAAWASILKETLLHCKDRVPMKNKKNDMI
jgi:hypothetical protein